MVEPGQVSERRLLLRLVLRSPASLAGLVIVAGFVFVAVFGPLLAPYPDQAWGAHGSAEERFLPPSPRHPFGTDEFGRDILSRVLAGARLALVAGVSIIALALAIGVPAGLVAGVLGGWAGMAVNAVVEVFLAFPPVLLALILAATLGGGYTVAILALALTWWPWYARVAYSLARSAREQPYVQAARVLGFTTPYIAVRHILPNVAGPLLVQATLDVGTAILEMSALSFLGLGPKPPAPDWGLMVSLGRNALPYYWWVPVFPGLAIFLVVLGFNLLGDALREVLDPRLRRLSLQHAA